MRGSFAGFLDTSSRRVDSAVSSLITAGLLFQAVSGVSASSLLSGLPVGPGVTRTTTPFKRTTSTRRG